MRKIIFVTVAAIAAADGEGEHEPRPRDQHLERSAIVASAASTASAVRLGPNLLTGVELHAATFSAFLPTTIRSPNEQRTRSSPSAGMATNA